MIGEFAGPSDPIPSASCVLIITLYIHRIPQLYAQIFKILLPVSYLGSSPVHN